MGCLFSAIAGAIDPVNAVIFAEVLNIFTLSNPDEQSRRATLYGLLFLALGGVGLIAYIMEVRLRNAINLGQKCLEEDKKATVTPGRLDNIDSAVIASSLSVSYCIADTADDDS